MKALVFILVLVNLLFYAFGGYFGHPDNPDAGRSAQQVQPERMRIVSRGEAPANPGAQPAPAPVPVPAAAPEPVIEPTKEAPVKAEPVDSATACLLWEHLNKADADRLQGLLTERFAEFKLVRRPEANENIGWWVSIRTLQDKAEANKKASELLRLGVSDYFIIQDGPTRYAISLGVYATEKSGKERLAELVAKGVRSARLTQRGGKDVAFSVWASGPANAQADLFAAVGKPPLKSNALDCP